MTLHDHLRQLELGLVALQEGLAGLDMTLREDAPEEPGPALVDLLGDAGGELQGWLASALTALARERAGESTLAGVTRTLVHCHERLQRCHRHALEHLFSLERQRQLQRLAQQRPGAWRRWALAVAGSLERLQWLLADAQQAVFDGWRELSERLLERGVSVQATNIGQQIRVPHDHVLLDKEAG